VARAPLHPLYPLHPPEAEAQPAGSTAHGLTQRAFSAEQGLAGSTTIYSVFTTQNIERMNITLPLSPPCANCRPTTIFISIILIFIVIIVIIVIIIIIVIIVIIIIIVIIVIIVIILIFIIIIIIIKTTTITTRKTQDTSITTVTTMVTHQRRGGIAAHHQKRHCRIAYPPQHILSQFPSATLMA
jgi:hypothetical protein